MEPRIKNALGNKQSSEKFLKVCLYGLYETNTTFISNSVEEHLGIKPALVKKLGHKSYLVIFKKGTVTLNKLRSEVPRIQCNRCLGYFHTADKCMKPVKCVRLGENHDSANCVYNLNPLSKHSLIPQSKIRCGNHTGNYKGCTARPKPKNATNESFNSNNYMESKHMSTTKTSTENKELQKKILEMSLELNSFKKLLTDQNLQYQQIKKMYEDSQTEILRLRRENQEIVEKMNLLKRSFSKQINLLMQENETKDDGKGSTDDCFGTAPVMMFKSYEKKVEYWKTSYEQVLIKYKSLEFLYDVLKYGKIDLRNFGV